MLATEIGAGWSRARPVSARDAGMPWGTLQPAEVSPSLDWGKGHALDASMLAGWDGLAGLDVHLRARWTRALSVDRCAASPFDVVPVKDLFLTPGWDRSIQRRDLHIQIRYNPMPARADSSTAPRFQRSDEHGPRFDAELERDRSLYVPGSPLAFTFSGQRYTPSNAPVVFFDFRYAPAPRVIQPVDSGAVVNFRPARRLNLPMALLWGRARPLDPVPTGIEYPDYEGPITIIVPPPAEPDILETYMIANSVSLVVLPGRAPLAASSIRVERDIDSFAWTLQAQLVGRTSLNLVRPDAAGPKEVELAINGHTWSFIIERYTGTGKLADERYTVTGVSLTQLLAKPYAPARSQTNTAPVNAEQAAVFELEYTDFTVNWDTWVAGPPDWTMPPGAFSYSELTPMEVIAKLAETAGGVVRPALNARELTVLPRYREPVWQWSSAIMDKIIPAAMVTDWGSEWQPQPEWNSCYVSGTNHGIGIMVRRAGTAGDNPTPDVYDDWMTGEQAGRARGIAELCKGGNQEIVTLNLPLFPSTTAPGLVEPAMLCEVRDIDETWRGLCLATSIDAQGVGAARVTQTLRLERHHREGA
ncbi:hypothetical protein ACFSB1_11075 [Halopseudomonas phragmitis]|uniref:Uncharacterized protein n=1 Tax=Halopseudomonas phragmitis TaxID=1931241 RepID=A0A1V0B9M0_9GAMM|nr:hypothetical protein [Halopseudomonas phragmitis]AQZ96625.1 hypothetical protein BVH74_18525 [Halopseudomonas phragmitis]